MNHKLVDNTLIRSKEGIDAICTCGWSSRGHFTSLGASSAFQDHQEQVGKEIVRSCHYKQNQQ